MYGQADIIKQSNMHKRNKNSLAVSCCSLPVICKDTEEDVARFDVSVYNLILM